MMQNLIIGITTTILGSGLISNAVMYFIKRRDNHKKHVQEQVSPIIDKLCEYGIKAQSLLEDANNKIQHLCNELQTINNEIKEENAKYHRYVDALQQLVQMQEKCVKNQSTNCEDCKAIMSWCNCVSNKFPISDENFDKAQIYDEKTCQEIINDIAIKIEPYLGLANQLSSIYKLNDSELSKNIANIVTGIDIITYKIVHFKKYDVITDMSKLLLDLLDAINNAKLELTKLT